MSVFPAHFLNGPYYNCNNTFNFNLIQKFLNFCFTDYVFDAINEERTCFNQYATQIGRNVQETEKFKDKNAEQCAAAQRLYEDVIYKEGQENALT